MTKWSFAYNIRHPPGVASRSFCASNHLFMAGQVVLRSRGNVRGAKVVFGVWPARITEWSYRLMPSHNGSSHGNCAFGYYYFHLC